MPHFHFHTADGRRLFDSEGCELPDLDCARAEAVRLAGELLREAPYYLRDEGTWRVEVTDTEGMLLFTFLCLGIDAPRGIAAPH